MTVDRTSKVQKLGRWIDANTSTVKVFGRPVQSLKVPIWVAAAIVGALCVVFGAVALR